MVYNLSTGEDDNIPGEGIELCDTPKYTHPHIQQLWPLKGQTLYSFLNKFALELEFST